MPNLEEAIRERAYHLWIADGKAQRPRSASLARRCARSHR